jgi:hypothetical protein
VTATFSGGTPKAGGTYELILNGVSKGDFASPHQFTGLAAGDYTVKVVDANGCFDTDLIHVGEPTAISASETKTDATCNGASNGSITVNVSGGTAPYSVTVNGVTHNGVTSSTTFTGLASGTYPATITDAHQCPGSADGVLVGQPTKLGCSITPPEAAPSCGSEGNTITGSITGGSGSYVYSWSLDSGAIAAGWAITGPSNTTTVTYTAGATGTATFTLSAYDTVGGTTCNTSCTVTVSCSAPQEEFCGLTQGFYGNQGGKFGCDPAFPPELRGHDRQPDHPIDANNLR